MNEQSHRTGPHDCEIINKILLREATLDALYLTLAQECDYPGVKGFAYALVEERKKHLAAFERSVNKLYSSFDPAGC